MSNKKHSGLTVHRAIESEHGDRLVEIVVEHIRLANIAAEYRLRGIDAEIIDERIQQLRIERDGILELFESEED